MGRLKGTSESVLSAASAAVTNTNDPVSGAVSITGTATQGQVLTADASGLSDPDGVGAFSYVWKADGTTISGATGSTYTLTQAEVGKTDYGRRRATPMVGHGRERAEQRHQRCCKRER